MTEIQCTKKANDEGNFVEFKSKCLELTVT